ncbi:hypothetical protein K7432_008580 [Basidiobolus ranarum]|uniref:Uncharacterized protein n=1 Tax=Basidiobolus ranarum TaxID=34480 RepID=A0ABR2WRK7_9FUNG
MRFSVIALLWAMTSVADVIGMAIPNTLPNDFTLTQLVITSRHQKRYNDQWSRPDDLHSNGREGEENEKDTEDSINNMEQESINPDQNAGTNTQSPKSESRPMNSESGPMNTPQSESNKINEEHKENSSPEGTPNKEADSKRANESNRDAQDIAQNMDGNAKNNSSIPRDLSNGVNRPGEASIPLKSDSSTNIADSSTTSDFSPEAGAIRNNPTSRSQCEDIRAYVRALGIDSNAVICIGGLVKVLFEADMGDVLNPSRERRQTCRDIVAHADALGVKIDLMACLEGLLRRN